MRTLSSVLRGLVGLTPVGLAPVGLVLLTALSFGCALGLGPRVAPGSVAPGSVAPGSVAPGSVAPGSVAPDRAKPRPADRALIMTAYRWPLAGTPVVVVPFD